MKDARGFSLIEMLISLSIFAVITGFVMANYRAGQQGDELRISAQLVGSMVRRAQTAAIAGGEISYCTGGGPAEGSVCTDAAACPSGSCTRDIPRGYGVRFSARPGENRSMIYFADTAAGNKTYNLGEAVRTDSISSGRFVDIVSVSPEIGGVLDIVFTPPKPNTFFNGDTEGITGLEAVITLQHRSTGTEKTVRINRISGQVNID